MNENLPLNDALKPLLTLVEVARMLRLSPNTIRGYCKTDKMQYILTDRKYLFEEYMVRDFLNNRKGSGTDNEEQ